MVLHHTGQAVQQVHGFKGQGNIASRRGRSVVWPEVKGHWEDNVCTDLVSDPATPSVVSW